MTSPPRPDPAKLPSFDVRASDDPIERFALWWSEAQACGLSEPAAMTLATADADGRPSARVVLLRAFDARGFVFFTNRESKKGKDLAARPQASLCFFWDPLHRQVRVDGEVVFVDDKDADDYFASRPRDSQLSAWASDQSRVAEDEGAFERRLLEVRERMADGAVARPPHWGGYRVVPRAIEFWQEGPFRRHRRDRYERQPAGWRRSLLQP